jgi:hypothetical protein
MGVACPKCNVLFLQCQATRATGTIWDATGEEVTAATGEATLKYKYEGDESRIEVKEFTGERQAAAAVQEAVAPPRKWMVFGVFIDPDVPEHPSILVHCELSGATGAVFDYTEAEFERAKGQLLATYCWQDVDRVQVMIESAIFGDE